MDFDPSTGAPTGKEAEAGAVKVRHILYSPNGDPQAAASLAPDDAAWQAAEDKANATYERLKANPQLFPEIAKAESNDSGSASRGGTYWFTPNDGLLQAFADAIFAPGLQPGQLLPPVKTEAGWHVIQILHFAPDVEWAAKLKADIEAGTISFAGRRPGQLGRRGGGGRRRHRLDRQGPDRPGPRGRDLRGARRQGERRARRPGPGDLPVLREARRRPAPRTPTRRRPSRPRRSRPGTRKQKADVHHHPRPGHHGLGHQLTREGRRADAGRAPRRGPAPVGPRPGRRPGHRGGRAPGRHARRAVDPRPRGAGGAAAGRRPGRRRHRASAGRPARGIGRRPRAGAPPALSGGPSRRTPRRPGAHDGRRAHGGRPRRPAVPRRRSRPSPTPRRRGACPGSPTACGSPDGCPWDREQTHASLRGAPARGGLRGLRRARGGRHAGARRRARRPAAPGRPPRAARGGGRACST